MNRPRILMADDHRIVAEGLKSLLEPDFDLIEIVEDGSPLVEAAMRLAPDVILADIMMPRLNGLEALERLQREGHLLDDAQRRHLRRPGPQLVNNGVRPWRAGV